MLVSRLECNTTSIEFFSLPVKSALSLPRMNALLIDERTNELRRCDPFWRDLNAALKPLHCLLKLFPVVGRECGEGLPPGNMVSHLLREDDPGFRIDRVVN